MNVGGTAGSEKVVEGGEKVVKGVTIVMKGGKRGEWGEKWCRMVKWGETGSSLDKYVIFAFNGGLFQSGKLWD